MPLEVSEVDINDVPEPEPGPVRGKYRKLFAQLLALKSSGKALKVTAPSEPQAITVRTQLRKLAKESGEFLSSSHSHDGKTRFFWLETEK